MLQLARGRAKGLRDFEKELYCYGIIQPTEKYKKTLLKIN